MKTNLLTTVLGVLLLAGITGCDSKPVVVNTSASVSVVASNAPVLAVAATNEFAVLQGRWQRGDADYVIEIGSAAPDGKLVARYFNPRSINVSQAQASRKDDGLQVFVELRDVNYPGCTYTLAYDAKNDQLFGQYYQAVIKQTFDVAFGRVK